MRPYLHPTAPIASHAVLTDDPKGAMDLASALCDSPRMSNLAHGLWGYGGTTGDGLELTIQSLGIGGPSASAVVSELAGLGVSRAIRVGSCVAADPALEAGAILVPAEIEVGDGVGRTLCESATTVDPDPDMVAALLAVTDGKHGLVRSVDLIDRGDASGLARAIDLSSAAVIATARSLGVFCACALLVTESTSGKRLAPEAMESGLLGLGMRAGAALSALRQPSGA